MMDWLKYLPLELRQAGEDASFKGPSFSDAKAVTLMPGDNTIHLRAPRHRTGVPERYQIYADGNIDLSRGFRPSYNVATDNWEFSTILYRSWSYWLEWFGGSAGDLTISVDLLRRKEGREFQGVSLFYPRVFEYAVANYLNTYYGFKRPGIEFVRRAPVNWKSHTQLPIFSCSFEMMHIEYPIRMFFMFPITNRHIVVFSFDYSGSQKGILDEMRALARQIIESVQLELSPSSQAELERVKSDIGELSLAEAFAPLKWPVEVEEIEQTPPPAPMLSRV